MAKFREEASMFEQAASICEKSEEYGNGPTITDDQAQRAELVRDSTVSVNKVLQAEGNPLANSERELLVASPPKNKGGRPRKMTLAQINEANHGRAVAREP